MGAFDTTLGALLAGALINTYLYGLASFQYMSYYHTKFNDPIWIKILVSFLCCIDTAHSISVMYMIWVYLIDHIGDPSFVIRAVWPLPFSAVVVSLIAFVVQNFLAFRVHRLLGLDWLLAVYVIFTFGTMILGLVLGVKIMRMEFLLELMTLKPHLTVWLSMEVALDTSLSAILFVSLQQARTGFRRSDAVVNRLTRSAIQSGVFTSIFAILALVSFLALPNTLFYGTFGIPIGRAYSCTLMDTLLCRKRLRGIMDDPGNTKDAEDSVPTIFARRDWHALQVRKDVQTEVRFEQSIGGVGGSPSDPSTTKKMHGLPEL